MNKAALENEAKCSGYTAIGLCIVCVNVFGLICAIKIVCNLGNINVEYLKSYGNLKCWYLLGVLWFIAELVIILSFSYVAFANYDDGTILNLMTFTIIVLSGLLCIRSSFNSFSKLW